MSSQTRPQAYCPLCLARFDASSVEFCTRDGARLRPVESLGQRWEGRTIAGRYQIGRFLGAGGMAEVFEALDLVDAHRVAVKLIRPQAMAEATNVERFRREAQLVAMIDHQNVVRVEDFGALEDGVWYMVLELLEGRSLEEALEAGPLAPGLALEVALNEIIDALAALLGPDRAAGLLDSFAADGTFPNLVLLEGPLQVAAIKIAPRAAICALLGSVARELDEPGRVALREAVERASGRHGLELAPREWC